MGASILIVSVRHTGTRFLHDQVGGIHYHVGENKIHGDGEVSKDQQFSLVLSPLRNPKDVWDSWCCRYGLYCGTHPSGPIVGNGDIISTKKWFKDSWINLSELHKDIIFIPVDIEEGKEQIKIAEGRIGRGLGVDWNKRYGHQPRPVTKYKREWTADMDFIYKLPFIDRFYKDRSVKHDNSKIRRVKRTAESDHRKAAEKPTHG